MSLYLVTGGSGYLGSALVRELLNAGVRVRVLDLKPSRIAGVESLVGSVLDEALLDRAMDGVCGVFHLAAIAHLWTRDSSDYTRINEGGTLAVIEAVSSREGVRLVHVSTESLFLAAGVLPSSCNLPRLAQMAGPYTRSKWQAHKAVLDAANAGVDACIASPAVPIGGEDFQDTPPTQLIREIMHGGLGAYLECRLNVVPVGDVGALLWAAMQRGVRGEHYVLSHTGLRLSELMEVLTRYGAPRRFRPRIPYAVAWGAGAAMSGAAALTGRAPQATLEGVRLARYDLDLGLSLAYAQLGVSPSALDVALAEAAAWALRI